MNRQAVVTQPRPSASSGGRDTVAITLIAAVALALRLLSLRWAPAMEGDSAEYVALATRLASYGIFSADGVHPSTYRPPLYPALLAIGYDSGAPMPVSILLLQCVLGTATVVGTFVLARRSFGSRAALLAAAAYAAAPMSVRYCGTLLTETTFTFFVVAASVAWSALAPWRAGSLMGFAVLTRAVLGPFVLAMALVGVVLRRGTLVRMACAAMLIVSPWIARNLWHSGRPTIADAGWGTNLLFGTERLRTGSNPWAQLMSGATGVVAGDLYVAEQAARTEAIRRIRNQPTTWLVTRARQFPWLLLDNGVYLPLSANDSTFKRAVTERRWTTLIVKGGFAAGNAFVFLAAVAGLWRHRMRWMMLMPIWAVPAYLVVSHLPMYVEPRYGLPLEPYLLILAAAGICGRGAAERVLL